MGYACPTKYPDKLLLGQFSRTPVSYCIYYIFIHKYSICPSSPSRSPTTVIMFLCQRNCGCRNKSSTVKLKPTWRSVGKLRFTWTTWTTWTNLSNLLISVDFIYVQVLSE